MKSFILTVLLLAATAGVAQQGHGAARPSDALPQPLSAQELSENAADVIVRVARSMGRYARDVSEIPLSVQTTVYKFDTTGKQKNKISSSHSMQFVKRSYADGTIMRQLQARKAGLHRVSVDEVNGDMATSLLALLFDNGTPTSSRYDLVLHTISKRLEMKIADDRPCEGFDPGVRQERLRLCGETHLLVDSTTLDPLGAAFEAGGFPRTFGKIRYLSFRFTQEFQNVLMEGSGVPFLLPAKVVVTYESDRGKTIVESRFSTASQAISAAAIPSS